MTRQQLLDSIAHTIADYRLGEIAQPDANHVERWVSQFPFNNQYTLLEELNFILKKTYFSKRYFQQRFRNWIENKSSDIWEQVVFINGQLDGESQNDLMQIFADSLHECYAIRINYEYLNPSHYIYLDDGLFSGSRIKKDLEAFLPHVHGNAKIIILLIISHSSGEYYTLKKLRELRPDITFNVHSVFCFENKLAKANISEVLWPAMLPPDESLRSYMDSQQRFPFKCRTVLSHNPYQHRIFSSEHNRQVLEQQLLLAGLKIRNVCKNPKAIMRPLGYSAFGLGFGSMVVTYRNCPNNAPLALWWGEPDNPDLPDHHPFKQWYPLLPRKTYSQNRSVSSDLDFEWDE